MRRVLWFRHHGGWSDQMRWCLILLFAGLISPDAQAGKDAWRTRTRVPTLRGASAACVVGGKIHVIGGVTAVTFTSVAAHEVYDPSTNSWEPREPIPTPRGWASSAVVNDTIYVMGGGWPNAVRTVEAYDPATNTWTRKADLLSPRRAAQAGVVDGIIYDIGGNTDERNCEAYDPATNTWTPKPAMPGAGGDVAMTVYNGLVYTFGGGMNTTAYANVYAFNPQTNTWSQKRDMPTPRFGLQTYLVGGKIYAVGGTRSNGTALATVEVYDPVADTWETLENMPEPLAWFAGAVVDGRIYVISGTPDWGQSGTGAIWEYTPPFATAVRGEPSSELPKQFVLEQNYPNPFNPTTIVRYQLPLAGEVTLAVHDLLGREVAVLLNGRVAAGVHEVTFDGSGLSSGVYIYRLSAGDFVQSRRLLLLK